MFRNYFLTAWRNLQRNKAYSALNILGLAIGMAVALLIGLWVQYQYSFDRFLPGYRQVYQAHIRFDRNGETSEMMATPLPLSIDLRKEIPEIRYATHTDWMGNHDLLVGDKKFFLAGAQADTDFFNIFRYPVLKGDLTTALKETYSIVLTESTARSLFGNADALGKAVRVDNQHDLIVKAVIRDLPPNSTFTFNYVIPFSYYMATHDWVRRSYETSSWDNNSFQTFVALQPNVTYAQVEPKLKAIVKKYDPEGYRQAKAEIFCQAMTDWHLFSDFKDGRQDGGFIEYVRLFSLIGALVLLIACINFMNLATARSEKRAREVGVRKAIGSQRRDIIVQFLVESLVITFVAGFMAITLTQLAIPAFNILTRCSIHIPYESLVFWGVMAVYIFATGLLAGSRPALFLSSFRPVIVLKGAARAGRAATLPRKALVVLQFTCGVALIIGTLLIYRQVQYVKARPAGYDANRLVLIDGSIDLNRNYAVLKSDLLATRLVTSATMSSSPVNELWSWSGIKAWSGQIPAETLGLAEVDIADDYFSTLGIPFVAGKNFSGNLAADSLNVILNESAVKRMRYKDPLGQTITMYDHDKKIKVIGVVKDALMLSPFQPAEPTMFVYDPNAGNLAFRLAPNADMHEAMQKIAPLFNRYNPAYPFLYHFADESYAQKFQLEVLVGSLAGLFAGLAIFISCLGLFGLSAYMAEQRTREIGIRKVLGASVTHLWLLLTRDFIVLVAISCIVASPLAYYFLHNWLQKYSYRITIGPGVFLVAGAVALVITILTISFQAIKSATANPSRSLRSE
ncbi:ABC transporter permease [Puia dinghuensis]|uniref:ABC transporter permease n=1 Tax=Puia dinghuensis TaxID=1792502 RepID=A0A8J2UCB0_9BACT|nr:ABC transporter permease [Puia dinghuensis]GGA97293.1 ABC transporter permease [Puia dinghuensis]